MSKEKRITVKEMEEYGYKYDKMYPLTKTQAMDIWKKHNKTVYKLFPDNTEAMVEDPKEIENFNGIFGIEAKDFRKCYPVLTTMGITIQMDRKVEKDHYIIPGGYELSLYPDGESICFDFHTSVINFIEDNKISFEAENLDMEDFPDIEPGLTKDFLKRCSIAECYIYTGEANEDPEIHPVKILSWSFNFSDGTTVELSEKLLTEYHFEQFSAENLYDVIVRDYEAHDVELNDSFFSVPVREIPKADLLNTYARLIERINGDYVYRIQDPVKNSNGTVMTSGKILPLCPHEFKKETFTGLFVDFLKEVNDKGEYFRFIECKLNDDSVVRGELLDFIP